MKDSVLDQGEVHAPSFIYSNINTQNNVMEIMYISTLKHRECESEIVRW